MEMRGRNEKNVQLVNALYGVTERCRTVAEL